MRVKVLKEFVDKHSGQLHTVGSTFECDDARFKEVQDAGSFIEPVPVIKEKVENIKEKVEKATK